MFIADNSLYQTFAYLDNITICGKSQDEYDENLNKFTEVAKKFNSIYDHNKCSFSNSTVDRLGYTILEGTIKPDPKRLQLFKELPFPCDIILCCVGNILSLLPMDCRVF